MLPRQARGWRLAVCRRVRAAAGDRLRRSRATPFDSAANAAMAERMLEARPVLLFPEGTTGHGLFLRKFHSSHFAAAARDLLARAADVESVAIQPAAISYSSPSAAWVGDAFLLPHVWRVLTGEPSAASSSTVRRCPMRGARIASSSRQNVAARIAVMRAAADPLRGEGVAASANVAGPRLTFTRRRRPRRRAGTAFSRAAAQ